MKYIATIFLLFTLLFGLQSCATTEQTTTSTSNQDSVYVFDSPLIDSVEVFPEPEMTVNEGVTFFGVQIGAFSTREKADYFASESKIKLNKEVSVVYGTNNNLYVVQLKDLYSNKKEAITLRNSVWKIDGFRDAFIVKIIK